MSGEESGRGKHDERHSTRRASRKQLSQELAYGALDATHERSLEWPTRDCESVI